MSGIADTTDETNQDQNTLRYLEHGISKQSNIANPSGGHNTHVYRKDGRARDEDEKVAHPPTLRLTILIDHPRSLQQLFMLDFLDLS